MDLCPAGRYFASSPYTLATCVIGKKGIQSGLPVYIISDGVFRSFAKLKWFECELQFAPLKVCTCIIITHLQMKSVHHYIKEYT